MKVRFAVVGCGSIGKRHVAVIDAHPEAEAVALCDLDTIRAGALAEVYDNIPVFDSYSAMLDQVQADVICIATPHAQHAPMAIEALEKRYNVLVEKPMALNAVDGERMNAAARRFHRKLWVVKQNRFNVPVQLAHRAIREGHLGKIFAVKCDILWNRYQGYYDDSPWRGSLSEEGGALFTQASHFIDLLIWWCGDLTLARGYAETQNHQIETEDTGVAVLRFENGAIGSLVWTTCVFRKNLEGSITIVGEKGTIKIGGEYLNRLDHWDVPGLPLEEGVAFTDTPNSYGKYQGTSSNHDKVFNGIIAEIRGLGGITVEGVEGVRSIRAIEEIYRSIRAK